MVLPKIFYEKINNESKREIEAPLLFLKEMHKLILSQTEILNTLQNKNKILKDVVVPEAQKQKYFNIVKASMTSSQLELIKLALEKEGYMDRSTIDLFLG